MPLNYTLSGGAPNLRDYPYLEPGIYLPCHVCFTVLCATCHAHGIVDRSVRLCVPTFNRAFYPITSSTSGCSCRFFNLERYQRIIYLGTDRQMRQRIAKITQIDGGGQNEQNETPTHVLDAKREKRGRSITQLAKHEFRLLNRSNSQLTAHVFVNSSHHGQIIDCRFNDLDLSRQICS